MNNEPVAWMVDTVITYSDDIAQGLASESGKPIIPLYTHPAKPIDKPDECISGCPKNQTCDYCAGIKTLTDEEIIEVFESPFHPNTTGKINDEVIAFARAILRKAQEK